MNISINETVLKKNNVSLDEFLVLFLCSRNTDILGTIQSLIDKGIVEKNLYNQFTAVVSNNTKELISGIIIDSDKTVVDKDAELQELAGKMIELFPKGRKEGTTYMWRDSKAVIAKKLKTLMIKFDFKFTEEEALQATKRYVESFGSNRKFMQLLKYFILKTDSQTGEIKSDFMSLIENKDDAENNNADEWTATLVQG